MCPRWTRREFVDLEAPLSRTLSRTVDHVLGLAMTVSPLAAAGAKFSDKTQYVFHTSSGAFGATTSNVDVICTFDTAQNISCWVGTDDYVTGNASASAGISSTSGKTKVFAGM